MKKLMQAALVGGGLILIDRPESIRRYRACMEWLGIEPTKLTQFHIDGIGWSPEIAEEFGNRFYLSHRIVNPRGIIITINQGNRPIYMPTHSFDRLMMRRYFEKNRRAIADLTTETGIALEIDQRLTWYRTVEHVDSVRSIKIVSHAGPLSERYKEQLSLIAQFMREDEDFWMEEGLRTSIIENFSANGMLYNRHLAVDDFLFKEFDDYYTCALGGIYVFRHNHQRALIVAEDEALLQGISTELAPCTVALSDPALSSRIRTAGIADIDIAWYRDNPEVLRDRLWALGLYIISSTFPEMEVDEMTRAQVASALANCDPKHTKLCVEFEDFIFRLTEGKPIDDISLELETLLLHPVNTSSKYEENLVWRLICQIQKWPVDLMRLYSVDKNLFLDRYLTFSKPMRALARKQIEHYNSEKTYTERK